MYSGDFRLKEVEASSSRGCEFCREILKFALSCGAIDLSTDQASDPRCLEVITSDETSSRFIFVVPLAFPYEPRRKALKSRLCRGKETIKMNSTADDHVIDQAKLWWEACIRKHKCQPVSCSYKPTRLLRLEHKSNDTVIWLVTVTQPVQYVTLSHRWSKETEEISLSWSNLHRRMERGILATELPRLSKFAFTLPALRFLCSVWISLPLVTPSKIDIVQDVIYVLRRFRIEYLWIDSFCIIQGDDGDWRREAGSMASIYKNAAFTISATKSKGSYDSLFSDPTGTATGVYLGTLPGGFTVRIEEYPRHPFYYLGSDVGHYMDDEGLLGRGWVYQEVLLSPRTLFFLNHEIMWRCQEYRVCQCARYDADEDVDDCIIMAEEGSTERYHVAQTKSRQLSSRPWPNVIEDYATRQFTYPKDRLAALAGVAEEYANETQWTYICGLWQENISQNLLWHRHERDSLKARPDWSENIPTWSWASMSSLPDFRSCDANSVELKSYHAVYNDKEENPYLGDVKDAVLTIEGHVAPAKLIRMSDHHKLPGITLAPGNTPEAKYGVVLMPYLVSLTEDCVLDESILGKPDVLLLGFLNTHWCLVLRCVDNISETYKRLGVLFPKTSRDMGEINWIRRQLKLV